jgi:nucleotide-binding universal stress UspA family protein
MQRFRKLGVFLHDCPADDAALAYTGAFATLAKSASIYCIHVRDADGGDDQDPSVSDLEAEVKQRLPDAVAKIARYEVHTGTGVPQILKTARDDELDLIIVGRRLPSEQLGIGTAYARLARKAPCSVLVVPAQSRPHLGRVFVPVDFSDYAKLALEHGAAIAKASGEPAPQLVVHSNFTVGYGYSKLGLTLPKAIAERKAVCDRELKSFVESIDTTGLQVELLCTSAHDPETAIQEAAVARKMDLVVVGARGTGSVFMLGSTAERVLLHSLLPLLVVKRKGETSRVLDALFGSG